MASASRQLAVAGAYALKQDRRLVLFRGTVRSLARDAAHVVNDLRGAGDISAASAQEQLGLVAHYPAYLTRLCDGRA